MIRVMFAEEEARALLLEMQARLADGPHAALGVAAHATPADIRQAFLQLTKTFHPARFARLAPDIQKLSNEVFLALKASHEQLTKPKAPAGRTSSPSVAPANRPNTRPFGVPTVGTGQLPTRPTPPTGQPATRPTPPTRGSEPVLTRPTPTSVPVQPPPGRPTPTSIPAQRFTNAGTSPGTTPPASTMRAPASSTPLTRSSSPSTAPANRPVGSTPAPVRQPTPSSGSKLVSPAGQPAPAPRSSSTGQVLDPLLAPALELIARGQWDGAQRMLDALVTRNPQSKRYLAMASYCRGKRAAVEGRIRDAQIELQEALLNDPELDLAKTAIADLYKRK